MNEERDVDSVLRESEAFFGGRGAVHRTLRSLAARLDAEGIPYAILGGMALNIHGFVRETVDVDVLMSRESLDRFRVRLVGRGYAPAFPGALKSFRDVETGVRIDVIAAGDFPGDGRPKGVAFPEPAGVAVEKGGLRVVPLETLLELKLASGLSAEHRRLVDLADVQRTIEALKLPKELGDRLHPSVRAEYGRLWALAQRVGEGPVER
ncbi:MAG TPA: nucleotidyltransferase family protein [Thermoanaerobaculia bacterium]|nr:nucleotidyltransferase family protein [Thermoanaerobaculia bacterium]